MTATLPATRARLREFPLCDAKDEGGWCPRVAVSAVDLGRNGTIAIGFASRCPTHSAPGAVRICLSCRTENRGGDAWLCSACLSADPLDAAAWAL